MLGDFVVRDRLDIPWGGFLIPHGSSVIGMIQDISKSPEERRSRHINQRLYRSLKLEAPTDIETRNSHEEQLESQWCNGREEDPYSSGYNHAQPHGFW